MDKLQPQRAIRRLHKNLVALAALLLTLASADNVMAAPIVIAPTTNNSLGNATNSGLYGTIYNFSATDGFNPDYNVGNILSGSHGFSPVVVGAYQANTTSGINYGTVDSSDSQPLTTWLGADGSTVVYNGAPHITAVFNAGTSEGTLLSLTGYVKITPAMLNTPLTLSMGLDDGGSIVLNGTTVIDDGGIHGAAVITQQVIYTVAGLYPVTLGFYDGHATEAVLTADFGGGVFVSTPNGVALAPITLDRTAQAVQNYVISVGATSPTDPTFNAVSTALSNLLLGGVDGATYGNALKQLAPLKYSLLQSQTAGTVDFITNDLDDYLAHRRTDTGTFRPGNGVDLGGLNITTGDVDPGLQDVASHLLAFTGPTDAKPGTLSDSPSGLTAPGGTPTADLDQHLNFFTRGIVVMSQNFSGNDMQHAENTSGTLQFGADYQVTPNLLIGAFFGYSHGEGSLDEEGSDSTFDSYIPGVYASYADSGWYLNALAAGGINEFSVDRNIDIPGFSAQAKSDPSGEEEFGYISGGRDFHCGNWTMGPMAGVQYVHTTLDSFTENNAGLLDLAVNSHSDDSLRSRLGGRVYYAGTYGNVVWRPFLDAAWQHEFMENSNSLTSQFAGANVGTFSVPTPVGSRESALISIGTDIDINSDTTVFTAYRVEAGESNFFAQSVEAGMKITF